MAEPFIGEIRIFPYNFAPRGWSFCSGQLVPVSSNTALFSLLGTIYGGDGRTTFALPDLRGRAAMHQGRGPGLTTRTIGQRFGSEDVLLTEPTMPNHTHFFRCLQSFGDSDNPSGRVPAEALLGETPWSTSNPNVQMRSTTISSTGGTQSHDNMQPYEVLNFCIATVGLFPSRS